jgi:hypothetical protein
MTGQPRPNEARTRVGRVSVPPIVARNFRPIGKQSLVGRADIYVTRWRFWFYGVVWHRVGGRDWISFPAREWTSRDGKRIFSALGKFENHSDQRRFNEVAIAAIRAIAGEAP